MKAQSLTCLQCGHISPSGTRYCPNCREAVDPELVAELQWLYRSLKDLDNRIAVGDGEESIATLRNAYLSRYQQQRHEASISQPSSIAAVVARKGAAQTSEIPTSAQIPVPDSFLTDLSHFSWSAFLAEQAIAIIAYLGGFLLLVATLTFVVGAWNVFTDSIKLSVVIGVYLLFGGASLALSRMAGLRTIGRAYLGVFAMMTPLVGLAFYRFLLQGNGFSPSGVITITAGYAAITYLLIAWRTEIITYSYLGWTAALISALAIVPWLNASLEWNLVVLIIISIVYVIISEVQRLRPTLTVPALQLGILTSVIGFIGLQFYTIAVWSNGIGLQHTILVVGLLSGLVLSLLLSRYVRTFSTVLEKTESTEDLSALIDFFIPLLFAEVIPAIGLMAGIGHVAIIYLVAVTAIVEVSGAAIIIPRVTNTPSPLRTVTAIIAVALVVIGWINSTGDPIPQWHVVTTLLAGVTVTVIAALTSKLPFWTLLGGFFLSVAVYTAIPSIFTQHSNDAYGYSHIQVAFIAILSVLGIALSRRQSLREYGYVFYITAVANIAYAVSILFFIPNGWYATIALVGFIALMYAIASIERWKVVTIGTVPLVFAALILAPSSIAFLVSLAWVCIPVALAIVVRLRKVELVWVGAIYIMSVLASLFAFIRADSFAVMNIESLLLAFAAVAYVVAIIERSASISFVPPLYVTAAILFQHDPHALLILVVGLVFLGLIAGRIGGWYWSSPAYGAGAIVSVAAITQSDFTAGFTVIIFLVLSLLTYAIAVIEARAEVLIGTFFLGATTVYIACEYWNFAMWQILIGLMVLSWVYLGGQWVWQLFPWLRNHPYVLIGSEAESNEEATSTKSLTVADIGANFHRIAALVLGIGSTIFSFDNGFLVRDSSTQATVLMLVSVAGLFSVYTLITGQVPILRYVAGFALSLAVTWELRYFGADSVQAYIIPPGSYLIVSGTVIGGSKTIAEAKTYMQGALLTGSLTLLLPTLQQSFGNDNPWFYAVFLAMEAIIIAGVGLGLLSRLMVVAGLSFVGLAAIRGAVLAVESGVPVAVVIALFALALMGLATWLNLRVRQPLAKLPPDTL